MFVGRKYLSSGISDRRSRFFLTKSKTIDLGGKGLLEGLGAAGEGGVGVEEVANEEEGEACELMVPEDKGGVAQCVAAASD